MNRNSFKSLINIIIAFPFISSIPVIKNGPIFGCCTSKQHVEYIKFNSIKHCCECKRAGKRCPENSMTSPFQSVASVLMQIVKIWVILSK